MLRAEVRAFIAEERAAGRLANEPRGWTDVDRAFSQRCAAMGYVAMTWPRRYGGHERSAFERFVVCEELLAAGAPVGGHWIADRQSGPQILRNGTEALRDRILPAIASGRCTFAIGMSEPDSGSDLSSIRTRASRADGGWRLSGRKVWTTNGHLADYAIVLCRTEPGAADRHSGLSQFVVDLKSAGVAVRPIQTISPDHAFSEMVFDDCFVPEENLLGRPGEGWKLVTDELAFERSGPDRFLSTFAVLRGLVDHARHDPDRHALTEIGRLVSRLAAVRELSLVIAGLLQDNKSPAAEAAMMKELGTTLEQDIVEVARVLCPVDPDVSGAGFERELAAGILSSPCLTLRGGTREILGGIIARNLGLR